MRNGSDSNDRRCIRCNSVSVRSRSGTRRTRPYRVLPSLVVPDDCLIPTCARCGADYLDDETIAALGPVLEQAYRDELQRIAAAVIRRLSKWISQRRLELLIGLSQGYLSRLAAGDGVPSAQLVLLLGLLADGAPQSIRAIQDFWPSQLNQPEPTKEKEP